MIHKLSYVEKNLTYTKELRKSTNISDRKTFIIRLEKRNKTGFGEAAPLNGRTESVAETRQKLNQLTGQSPFASEELNSILKKLEQLPATRHGLSQARLDLETKIQSIPLSDYFNTPTTDSKKIPVNDLITGKPSLEKLKESYENGYKVMKFKYPETNLENLEKLDLFSTDKQNDDPFRIDFNENLPNGDLDELTSRVGSIPIDYLEQPFERSDLSSHQRLRNRGIPVALDESLIEYSIDEIADLNAADTIVIKPMTAGGIDRAARLVSKCTDHGIEPILTTSLEGPIGRAGIIQLALAFSGVVGACGLTTGKFIENDPDWEADFVKDGFLKPPDGIGNALPEHVLRPKAY